MREPRHPIEDVDKIYIWDDISFGRGSDVVKRQKDGWEIFGNVDRSLNAKLIEKGGWGTGSKSSMWFRKRKTDF